jgi:hydrogenase maturation protease
MTNIGPVKVLLIGFGNPGRLDDGLGPALAEAVEKLDLPGLTVDSDYQLTVEDAAEVAKYDVVVFADAAVAGADPFWVKRIACGPSRVSFSSHSVSPQAVLALTKELFDSEPKGYVLGIRGHEFNEFGERLSRRAKANLAEAIAYVESSVHKGCFEEVRPEDGNLTAPPTEMAN